MNLLGGFNYLNDLYKAQETQTAVTFKLSQFKGKYVEHSVDLIMRRIKASGKSAPVQKPQTEAIKAPVVEADDDDVFSLFGQFQAQVDQIEEKVVVSDPSDPFTSLSDDEEIGPNLSKEDIELLSLKDFQTAFLSLVTKTVQKKPAQNVEEQKQSPKLAVKEVVTKETKEDEAQKKLLVELQSMGFALEDCKSAYTKAKNKDLDTLLDILSEMQEKKKLTSPKVVEKSVEYNIYNCTVCTFLNDPPAKFCAICGTEAPATAIKVDLEAEKKKLEEEAKAKSLAEEKAKLLEEKERERAEKA